MMQKLRGILYLVLIIILSGILATCQESNCQRGALLAGPEIIPAEEGTPIEVGIFLEQGVSYIIVGEGTCSLWDGQEDGCDSVYRYRTPLESNGGEIKVWGQLELIDPNVHLAELLIKQTGKEDPGYNPDHKYEAVVIGEGKMLKARVFDGGSYGDNHGELKISVYEAICKEKSCQDICKEKRIEHLVSDEESKPPNCNCICEKGWQNKEGVCESCEDACKRQDPNSLYDPEKSVADRCDCTKCGDGYKYNETEQKCKKVKSCSERCSESTIEHLVWDEKSVADRSDDPNCGCICGKGWQDKKGVCESCEDACKRQDPNSLYDPYNSVADRCDCKCKVGYSDDNEDKKCKKVGCPPNSANIADIKGSSTATSCTEERKFGAFCCCNEGYIPYEDRCVKKESGGEEYFIEPVVSKLTIGKKIQFSVTRKKLGRYEPVGNDQIKWSVPSDKKVCEIDKNGVLNGLRCGECRIIASIDGKEADSRDVSVTCQENTKGDLNRIISLYKARIPVGLIRDPKYQQKINDLVVSGSAAFAVTVPDPRLKIFGVTLGVTLKSLPYGCQNNILSVKYAELNNYACGAYASKVLMFLNEMKSDPNECTLLNGFEYGPIRGASDVHHAVVIYPEGTDWKETGTVLDPWINQNPEVYSISGWSYMLLGASEEQEKLGISEPLKSRYPTSKTYGGILDATGTIILGILKCPVDILITDNEGRRLGMLDGSPIGEIPSAIILRNPNDESNNNNSWYFELNTTTNSRYTLEIVGTDKGSFELITFDSKNKQVRDYGHQPISKGLKAQIIFDATSAEAPLILPNGTEVQPTDFSMNVILQSTNDRVSGGEPITSNAVTPIGIDYDRMIEDAVSQEYEGHVGHKETWSKSLIVSEKTKMISAKLSQLGGSDKSEIALVLETPDGVASEENAAVGSSDLGPIFISNPGKGRWVVKVYGYNVPGEDRSFKVVVSTGTVQKWSNTVRPEGSNAVANITLNEMASGLPPEPKPLVKRTLIKDLLVRMEISPSQIPTEKMSEIVRLNITMSNTGKEMMRDVRLLDVFPMDRHIRVPPPPGR